MTAIIVAEITGTYSSFTEWLKLTVVFVNITPKHLKLKAEFKPDVLKSHTAVLIFKPRGQQKLKKPLSSQLLSSSCQISSVSTCTPQKLFHLW